MPDRVKSSFVIFDIRALLRSTMSARMSKITNDGYICTHMATVGVKGLRKLNETTKFTARWPLRHAALSDNYRLQIITKNEAFSPDEMCSTICEFFSNHFDQSHYLTQFTKFRQSRIIFHVRHLGFVMTS